MKIALVCMLILAIVASVYFYNKNKKKKAADKAAADAAAKVAAANAVNGNTLTVQGAGPTTDNIA